MNRPDALDIYATYTGLVYLTPLHRRLPGRPLPRPAQGDPHRRHPRWRWATSPCPSSRCSTSALGLLILGNGFFKPNISTMVGQLYPQGDPRRDGAYTIFYMGINLGAFFAPLVCGPLGETVGWHYGFAAAGVGMVFGLMTFVFTQRLPGRAGYPPDGESRPRHRLGRADWVQIVVIAAASIAALRLRAPPSAWPRRSRPATGRLAWLTDRDHRARCYKGRDPRRRPASSSSTRPSRRRPADAEETTLHEPFTERLAADRGDPRSSACSRSSSGWASSRRAGRSTCSPTRRRTGRSSATTSRPRGIQSINPLFIFSLAPALLDPLDLPRPDAVPAALDGQDGHGPDPARRGVRGDVLSPASSARSGKISPLWLISVYFIYTLAELCLSPIGLSLVNKLAHPRIASLMMAIWFLCTAVANYLAGIMEQTIEPYHLNLWAFLGCWRSIPGRASCWP